MGCGNAPRLEERCHRPICLAVYVRVRIEIDLSHSSIRCVEWVKLAKQGCPSPMHRRVTAPTAADDDLTLNNNNKSIAKLDRWMHPNRSTAASHPPNS